MTSFELWSRLNGPVANLHSGKCLSIATMEEQHGFSPDQCGPVGCVLRFSTQLCFRVSDISQVTFDSTS